MRQETGKYFIKVYDDLGSKVMTLIGESYLDCESKSKAILKELPDYSTTILRILYNSKLNHRNLKYED